MKKQVVIENKLLQELVDNIPDAIYFKDRKGHLVLVNKAHAAGLGLTPEDVVNHTDYDYFPKKLAEKFTRDDKIVIKTGSPLLDRFERTIRPDGSKHIVSTSKLPRRDDHSHIIGIMGITRDITERTRTEEAKYRAQRKAERQAKRLKDKLQIEKKKLEQVLSIIEGLSTIVNIGKLIDFIVDKTCKVLEAKQCTLMFFNEEKKELSMKGYKGLHSEEEINAKSKNGIRDSVAGFVARQKKSILVKDMRADRRFTKKNVMFNKSKSVIGVPMKIGAHLIGVLLVVDKKSTHGSMFTELDLKILDMIGRQAAIAVENARLYRELNELTITDPLTKMYNYRHFLKALDHEIKRMKRYSSDLCLFMIDVDNFKSYNDEFGHLEGDNLLKKISHVLKKNLRTVDITCRYAGDEFVAILPNTNLDEAKIVAEKIKKKIEELKLSRKVTISIGVSKYTKKMNQKDLILQADEMLYEAKKSGKNKVCCSKYLQHA